MTRLAILLGEAGNEPTQEEEMRRNFFHHSKKEGLPGSWYGFIIRSQTEVVSGSEKDKNLGGGGGSLNLKPKEASVKWKRIGGAKGTGVILKSQR